MVPNDDSTELASDLLTLARQGERAALSVVYESAQQLARSVIRRRVFAGVCGSGELADLEQEIITKIVSSLQSFDAGRNTRFSTWSYTIATNHVNSFLLRTVKNRINTVQIETVDEREIETPGNNGETHALFAKIATHIHTCGTPWQLVSYALCHLSEPEQTPLGLVTEQGDEMLGELFDNWHRDFVHHFVFSDTSISQFEKPLREKLSVSVEQALPRNDGVSRKRYAGMLDRITGNVPFNDFVGEPGKKGANVVANWNYNVRKRLAIQIAQRRVQGKPPAIGSAPAGTIE